MERIAWSAVFVVCWSSGFIGTGLLPPGAPPTGVLAWRYAVTALLLLPFAAPMLRGARGRDIARQAVLGMLGHVVFLGGVFGAAAAGVDPGTSALVCALQPMLVIGAGRLQGIEALGPMRAVGLLVGLLAVVLAVGGAGARGGGGVILVVGSLLGLSANALLDRRWPSRLPVLPALAVQVAAAALLFLGAAAATDALRLEPSRELGAALLWLVLMSGIGGYLGYIQCLRRIGPGATSALLYLTPPVTTLWGWAMLGDRPSAAQAIALLLGAGAVVLVIRGGRIRPPGPRLPRPAPTVRRSGP